VTQTRTGGSSSAFAAFNANASFQTDSLGAVYGRSTKRQRFSRDYQKLNETGIDFSYGYDSAYENRPGFGRAGFGDFGGNGYGSSLSEGDPGFVSPNRFTDAGVADNAGAMERFLRARRDTTALTSGPRAGRGVLVGGASVEVGGKVSAFALVSVTGELDLAGSALDSPQSLSDRRARMSSGFQRDNVSGVSCARPGAGVGNSLLGGSGVSTSLDLTAYAGFSASASASLSAGVRATASARAGVAVGI